MKKKKSVRNRNYNPYDGSVRPSNQPHTLRKYKKSSDVIEKIQQSGKVSMHDIRMFIELEEE